MAERKERTMNDDGCCGCFSIVLFLVILALLVIFVKWVWVMF